MSQRLQKCLLTSAAMFLMAAIAGSIWCGILPVDSPPNAVAEFDSTRSAQDGPIRTDSFLLQPLDESAADLNNLQIGSRAVIQAVPFIPRRPDFDGEACVAMFARFLGQEIDQETVFNLAGVDPLLGRGCREGELTVAMKKIGLEPGQFLFQINHFEQDSQFEKIWQNLQEDLKAGIPSIFRLKRAGIEEFVLVLGVDPEKDTILFHDPNALPPDSGKYRAMDRARFFEGCKLDNPDDRSGSSSRLVKLRLKPGPAMAPGTGEISNRPRQFTAADFSQHVRKLRTILPDDSFHIVIQKPFVVVGNEPAEKVEARARQTVKWATDLLKRQYFPRDPRHILNIWLFKDKTSYQFYNQKLFGKQPSTPFGYYSPFHKALVMNIATGGGTLVHEIVHPFMESNFEDCPSWFNEGLGSLYEQCRQQNGLIMGSTNWRLDGLQRAIRNSGLPTFEQLCKTTRDEFYTERRGINYAMARYLCYYLQEKGLLQKFYKSFVANVATDPSGYATLQDILGNPDMSQFQNDWEDFVLGLRR